MAIGTLMRKAQRHETCVTITVPSSGPATLAIAHALLGITVAITIPGPVVRNMRVGMGYLRYHAPHAHPPGLEPTPTTR